MIAAEQQKYLGFGAFRIERYIHFSFTHAISSIALLIYLTTESFAHLLLPGLARASTICPATPRLSPALFSILLFRACSFGSSRRFPRSLVPTSCRECLRRSCLQDMFWGHSSFAAARCFLFSLPLHISVPSALAASADLPLPVPLSILGIWLFRKICYIGDLAISENLLYRRFDHIGDWLYREISYIGDWLYWRLVVSGFYPFQKFIRFGKFMFCHLCALAGFGAF